MKFNLTEALQARSTFFRALFGIALMAGVTLAAYLTPRQIAFSVSYLLPVSYFAWFFRSNTVRVSAVVAAVGLWLLGALVKPQHGDAHLEYVNALIHLGLFLGTVFLVAEVKALYLRERQGSRSDFLTGVANRRAFHESLSIERERALRHGSPITLAYIDIDNFKQVNDALDHETGDQLLITVARELRQNIRRIDLVARLGGDEFCILLPQTNESSARSVLGKLAELLRHAMQRSGWSVTFSIGAVTFPKPRLPIDEMIKRTDELMYSVKASGKNQIAYALQE